MANSFTVPQGLFRQWDDQDLAPPATDEQIRAAEQQLGVKLPASLIAVLKVHDGGTLNATEFKLKTLPPEDQWDMDEYTIEQLPSVSASTDRSMDYLLQLAREEWDLPEGLVPLDGDGHWWCCLDYRLCGPKGEPSVVHVDVEDESDIFDFKVAESFSELIGGLHSREE